MRTKTLVGAPEPYRPNTTIELALSRWLHRGESKGYSPKTLSDRSDIMRRFLWWLDIERGWGVAAGERHIEEVNRDLIGDFLLYCATPNSEGRFGSNRPSARRAARPATVHRYYRELRAFLNYCVEAGDLTLSPLRRGDAPRLPEDQVQPLSDKQMSDLLDALMSSRTSLRDRAILLVLLDTGLRVSELCSLKVSDIDLEEIRVVGKGGKARSVFLQTEARRAVRDYLRARKTTRPNDPLFTAARGHDTHQALTPSGVRQAIKLAGERAGIRGVRVSPHTLRHTFAVNFVRNGGNQFALRLLLGHASWRMVQNYVNLANADLAESHRRASPVERLNRRRKRKPKSGDT